MAKGRMNSLEGRVPSDGGTKLFGASDLSFLTKSMAAATRSALVSETGSITLINVLCHAGEDLVYLVWRCVGGDMDLKINIDFRRRLARFARITRSSRCSWHFW